MPEHCVTALIGPSGCGKSTFLRCLNRMNDMIEGTVVRGDIRLDGEDIYRRGTDVVELRKRVGMVFQKSNPFPKSDLRKRRLRTSRRRSEEIVRVLDEIVETFAEAIGAVGAK